MTTQRVLRIDSSVSGSQGQSSLLADELIKTIQQKHAIEVTRRDLNAQPFPHLNGEILAALGMSSEQRTPEQQAWASSADQVIDELKNSDILVMAMPMYNFGVPSTVKAWMDYAARAGETFQYTQNGPEGLLKNKTAYILSTRGGMHYGQASDGQTVVVDTFLNFLGIKKIHWVYAEGIAMRDHKSSTMDHAKEHIHELVHQEAHHDSA